MAASASQKEQASGTYIYCLSSDKIKLLCLSGYVMFLTNERVTGRKKYKEQDKNQKEQSMMEVQEVDVECYHGVWAS